MVKLISFFILIGWTCKLSWI